MASEQKGFIIAVAFVIIFSGLVVSIPADLLGAGETPNMVTPIDPSLLTDFVAHKNWTMTSLNAYGIYMYSDLGNRDWWFSYYAGTLQLGAKILFVGLWFGQIDSCEFISDSGVNRGYVLAASEVTEDACNGTVRYTLQYVVDGTNAGGFIIYWNTTAYSTVSDAYTANDVYFLHGVGIVDTATMDATALLVSLLLFQLPDCPPLINLLLATPIWAAVVYLFWFIIKESLPFI